MKREYLLHRSESTLLWLGVLLLGVAGFSLLRYHLFQSGSTLLDRTVNFDAKPVMGPFSRAEYLLNSHRDGRRASSLEVTGRLEVPRLGLSVLVVDGDEEQGLNVAAVHLAGTAPVGGAGNAVIAGHRDTAFWPLRNLKVGDLIRVQGPVPHQYRVRSIQIVDPENTAVLEGSAAPILTLVTCYPFRYIGNAPRRFVVQAQLIR